jgi:TM2 domain-containing membrane protein YozV
MEMNSLEMEYMEQHKNPAVAAVLSFFISGAGQIYNGDVGKGVAMIVGCILCWLGSALVIPLFLLPVIWICGMIEAHSRATEINASLKKKIETKSAEAINLQTVTSSEFVTRIQKASKLRENALLTEDEFENKKKDAISNLLDKKLAGSPEDFLTAIIPLVREKILTEEEIAKIKAAIL